MHHMCSHREMRLGRIGDWLARQAAELERWDRPASQTEARKALLECQVHRPPSRPHVKEACLFPFLLDLYFSVSQLVVRDPKVVQRKCAVQKMYNAKIIHIFLLLLCFLLLK